MMRTDAIAIRKPPKPKPDKGAVAPPKSKIEIAREAWKALSGPERKELVRGEPAEIFLADMSDTQRDTLVERLERLVEQQIERASLTVSPTANDKKLLTNANGNFRVWLSHPDPAMRVKGGDMLRRRIEASGLRFGLTLLKPPRSKK
jgi:hypothetical protein